MIQDNIPGQFNRVIYIFVLSGLVVFFNLPNAHGGNLSLISAEKVTQLKGETIIIDSRTKKEFEDHHIPGALSMDWYEFTHTDEKGIPYRIFPRKIMAQKLSSMGINENSTLIVYGSGSSNFGGEGWCCWVFQWLGHRGEILLLKGGIQEWENKKYPLEKGVSKKVQPLKQTPYGYGVNENVDADMDDIRSNRFYIIDTRTLMERVSRGRIPGSIHISWKKFFQKDGTTPLAPADVEKLLENKNIPRDKPVIYYCTGGIRSAWTWLVHSLAGIGPARNFEGGMVMYKVLNEQ